MKTTEKHVPADALRWTMPFEFGAQSREKDSQVTRYPITMVARTGKPVRHWYWGSIVHDMAGLKIHKPELPVDYCHDYDQVIGYLDTFDTESGDLKTSGELVSTTPGDRASEIAAKADHGVPYEASITFDPNRLVIEEVAQDMSAEVNGQTVKGPITIIRQWNLRGVAVCPYGQDMNTSTKFAEGQPDQVTIQTLKGVDMSKDTDTQAKPTAATDQAPADAGKQTDQAPADAGKQTDQVPADAGKQTDQVPADAGKQTADPVEGTKETPVVSEGQRFMNEFGAQGAVWFAEGKSFEDATKLHFAAIEKENAALKTKLSAVDRGEAEPVSFADGDGQDDGKQAAAEFDGDENRGKFCAGIKVPTK